MNFIHSAGEQVDTLNDAIYAAPRRVEGLAECYFYHTMDIPGYGHVEGEWDLRENTRDYLGRVVFNGKRVLEVGVASGFLSFYMESQGAEVVGFDLSEQQSWDIVPYAGYDYGKHVLDRKAHIRRINSGFWLCHKAFKSKARMVYGTVYAIPQGIGIVDISTFGSILLHVRDPFLALQNALRLTKETVIISDGLNSLRLIVGTLLSKLKVSRAIAHVFPPSMAFLPRDWEQSPLDTWWQLNPEILIRFIGVLGFERAEVIYHFQRYRGRRLPLFTIVGHRTKAMA